MYPGKKMTLGGRELIVPALSLRQAKEFQSVQEDLLKPNEVGNPWAKQELGLPMYLAAIQRNHPEITLDFLADNVDLNSCKLLFKYVIGNTPEGELELPKAVNAQQ